MKNVARLALIAGGLMCLTLTACHKDKMSSQMDGRNEVAAAGDTCDKGDACCKSKESVAKAEMNGQAKDCCDKDMKHSDMKGSSTMTPVRN
ncbi:hypothetical protein BH11PLA1_BH11PLA1_03200 [soil metagenome]